MFGTALAHLGLGLTVLGIVGALCFGTERILSMQAGQTVDIAGRALRFEGLYPARGPNFTEERGRFVVLRPDDSAAGEVISAKRLYPVRQTTTTEAGIRTIGFSQLYISLGDQADDGSVVVRIWWKPLVTLIWGGGLVMMLGGLISLMDRRLRVGAPTRRKVRGAVADGAGVS
jgi:cytochrome c-type biogenesis protein CcmF